MATPPRRRTLYGSIGQSLATTRYPPNEVSRAAVARGVRRRHSRFALLNPQRSTLNSRSGWKTASPLASPQSCSKVHNSGRRTHLRLAAQMRGYEAVPCEHNSMGSSTLFQELPRCPLTVQQYKQFHSGYNPKKTAYRGLLNGGDMGSRPPDLMYFVITARRAGIDPEFLKKITRHATIRIVEHYNNADKVEAANDLREQMPHPKAIQTTLAQLPSPASAPASANALAATIQSILTSPDLTPEAKNAATLALTAQS